MRVSQLAFAFSLLLLACTPFAYGAGSSVSAGVTVQCPFVLQLHTNAFYSVSSNQIASFTAHSQYNCSISSMSGTFQLLEQNGTSVYSLPISGINVATEPTIYNITFNASSVPAGTYIARLQLSYDNSTNSSSTKVLVNTHANISIVNFSTSPSIRAHSLQSFYAEIKNTGSFALTNSISISIRISGPTGALIKEPSNYSLSPLQSLNLTITSYNSTAAPGSYAATLNVTYMVGNTIVSKYKTIAYAVTTPSTSTPVPKPVVRMPQFSLVSFPYLVSLYPGKSQTGFASIKNTGNVTEYVNVRVPQAYSDMLSIAATNVSISAGQTVGIGISVHIPASEAPGTYIVPLNITASIDHITSTETLYTTIIVPAPGKVAAQSSITLTNNTNSASGTVYITNPTKSNLTNVEVQTLLPGSMVSNMSSISAYGLPYSLSKSYGSYVIDWHISNLPANSSTYAYFLFSNITDQAALARVSEQMAVPSVPVTVSLLKVVDISVPTFYVGTENTIALSFFYSGTSPQQVSAYMTGPPNVKIYNSSQRINATPNSAYAEYFGVEPSATGTAILNLYISTQGANLSYSIPLLVLSQPTTTIATTVPPAPIVKPMLSYEVEAYGLPIAILLVIAVIIILITRLADRPRYSRSRVEKLKRIKSSIKRQ